MSTSINPQVVTKCMSTPFSALLQGQSNAYGDRGPDTVLSFKCYFAENNTIVINDLGLEELSGSQLYITGEVSTQIVNTALISCKDKVKKRIIRKSSWDLPGGPTALAVIYLP